MGRDHAVTAGPTPLTLIAGYLGAGKTTLVNQLLRQADGLRIAVLVNDFGDIDIDAELVVARDGPVISLAGGCVCCSFGSDLIGALVDLVGPSRRIDHIVVEASGVGLPAAIAHSVALLPELRFDGTVLVADAESVRTHAEDRYVGELVREQLCQADLLVLNNADLRDANALQDVRAWLATLAPGVPVLESVHAQLPPALVLGSHASTPNRDRARHEPSTDDASARFVSRAYRVHSGADARALARALAETPMGIVRAKGLVTTADGMRRALHVVGRRHALAPAPQAGPAASGRLVLIVLRERFDAAALDALLASHGAVPS
ncbi:MAG: GTP-binding protein [Burkholderiales bacterium]|nr:MAG: GTP-binding protein [Burkholderiales bacterium]